MLVGSDGPPAAVRVDRTGRVPLDTHAASVFVDQGTVDLSSSLATALGEKLQRLGAIADDIRREVNAPAASAAPATVSELERRLRAAVSALPGLARELAAYSQQVRRVRPS